MNETLNVVTVTVEGDPPRTALESALMASAIAAGWRWADEASFLDTVETGPAGEVIRRTVWALLDEPVVVDGERMRFQEFREHWESEAWRAANPKSAITLLWRATCALHVWHADEFRRRPHLVVRNGMLFARIPPEMPEEEARALVAQIY